MKTTKNDSKANGGVEVVVKVEAGTCSPQTPQIITVGTIALDSKYEKELDRYRCRTITVTNYHQS